MPPHSSRGRLRKLHTNPSLIRRIDCNRYWSFHVGFHNMGMPLFRGSTKHGLDEIGSGVLRRAWALKFASTMDHYEK